MSGSEIYVDPNRGVLHAIDEMLYSDGDKYFCRVIDSTIVGLSVYYAAREEIDKVSGIRTVVGYAGRVSYPPRKRHAYINIYCETSGPVAAQCPKRILDLLTPTNIEYAKDWRRRCRNLDQGLQPKKKVGLAIGQYVSLLTRFYSLGDQKARFLKVLEIDNKKLRVEFISDEGEYITSGYVKKRSIMTFLSKGEVTIAAEIPSPPSKEEDLLVSPPRI